MTILRKFLDIPYCIRYSKLGLQGVKKNGLPKQDHGLLNLLKSSFRTSVYTGLPSTGASDVPEESRFTAFWKGTKWIYSDKTKLALAAGSLYESCADKVDFSFFFKKLDLPDIFVSWFLLTEIHVWMCIVRVIREGSHKGVYLRNKIVDSMWMDVEERLKKLAKNIPINVKREVITELHQHFQAALYAYDEGLMGEDKVLAAALWRNLFSCNCKNPEHLEAMVQYIRMQVSHLDIQSYQSICVQGNPNWLPFKEVDIKSI